MNRTKKVIHAKTERQINFNLPCKFGDFKRVEFLGAQNAPFWTAMAAKHAMKFDAHHFLRTLRLFYVEMPFLKGGEGICISVFGKETLYQSDSYSFCGYANKFYQSDGCSDPTEKKIHWLFERLASLGAWVALQNDSAVMFEGFQRVSSIAHPCLSRDTCLSESCTPDRCNLFPVWLDGIFQSVFWQNQHLLIRIQTHYAF